MAGSEVTMSDERADRIHAATPHRRQEARRQGNVPRSQDLVSAGLLLGGLVALLLLGGNVVHWLRQVAQQQWGGEAWLRADPELAIRGFRDMASGMAVVLLPVLCLLLLLALLFQVGQTGFLLLPHKMSWDVNRLNPWAGLQRICSRSSAVRLLLGLAKAAIVTVVVSWSVWAERHEILGLATVEISGVAAAMLRLLWGTCLRASLAIAFLALLDYAYQRWQHERDLRMTTQELREELRSLQGDPQVAARQREIQQRSTLR
jgi:flagellar biosynthetic protein FlhB